MSIELTWLGHACWLIKHQEHRILLDPFLNDSPTAPMKAADVDADTILVSHGHFDHVADVAEIATIKMTPAIHSSQLPDGSNGGVAAGFLVLIGDKKIYFACDTALFSDMKLIAEKEIDLAVLPIGDQFTMGPKDSVRAVKYLNAKQVLPSHYNTWPPIVQDAAKWAEIVKAGSITQPFVLEPGETHLLE